MGSIVKSLDVQKRTYISYNFDTKLGFFKNSYEINRIQNKTLLLIFDVLIQS